MKKIILLIGILFFSSLGWAQNLKWANKMRKGVFSLTSYKEGKLLNTGTGFFIGENGVAVSEFDILQNSDSAVITLSDGLKYPVQSIIAANDMYNVVKFRVNLNGKKNTSLQSSPTQASENDKVWLLPFSTQKSVQPISTVVRHIDKVASKYAYYTLALPISKEMVGAPIMNEVGQALAMAQKSSDADKGSESYAIDVHYINDMESNAMTYVSPTLNSIQIKKELPDSLNQALVVLYMVSPSSDPQKYMGILNDFIEKFPDSPEGYIRRASHRIDMSMDNHQIEEAEKDLDKALEVSKQKDDTYYNRAKFFYNYVLSHPKSNYKMWGLSKALEEIRKAIEIAPLPVYRLMEGDINFAMQDYPKALECYEQVNHSDQASPLSYMSSAKTKQLLKVEWKDVLADMDSCMSKFHKPYTSEAAPYLLTRADILMQSGNARAAVQDYNDYFKAVNGQVNDLFYYYREQAEMKCRQFQQALDDIAKAMELNPKEISYKIENAVVNIRINRTAEALKQLDEIIKLAPDYADAYRLKGFVLVQTGKKEEGCTNLHKALDLGDKLAEDLIKKYCN